MKYIIYNKDRFYRKFYINKRIGQRRIDAPDATLKRIQQNILRQIIYNYNVHKNATGFVPKRSIITNCKKHVGQRVVFSTDIQDFFPSIHKLRVKNHLLIFGLSHEVADFLTELMTYNESLPQGAPTSPYMSNLICYRLDSRLTGLAKVYKLEYSRYADDITFSGNRIPKSFIEYMRKIIASEGFKISHKKTRFISSGNRQVITGLVTNDRISMGKKKYNDLKAMVFNCKTKGIEEQNRGNISHFKEHLYGKIAILKTIDYNKWKKLKDYLDSLDWKGYAESASDSMQGKKIATMIDKINKSLPLFSIEANDIINLTSSCKNDISDFNVKITKLHNLTNRMEVEFLKDDLKDKIKGVESFGPIATLRHYLKHYYYDGEKMCEVLEDVRILSSGLIRHEGGIRKNAFDIIEKYGIKQDENKWDNLWNRILSNYNRMLTQLEGALLDINKTKISPSSK